MRSEGVMDALEGYMEEARMHGRSCERKHQNRSFTCSRVSQTSRRSWRASRVENTDHHLNNMWKVSRKRNGSCFFDGCHTSFFSFSLSLCKLLLLLSRHPTSESFCCSRNSSSSSSSYGGRVLPWPSSLFKGLLLLVVMLKSVCVNTAVAATWSTVSPCFAVDKNDYLYDFNHLLGKRFEYRNGDSGISLTVKFCESLEVKASNGGVRSFGKFPLNQHSFAPVADTRDRFTQHYYFGDLEHCEDHGFAGSGRSGIVDVVCGDCPSGGCKDGGDACICDVEYGTWHCSLTATLAVKSCKKTDLRVVKGLTVGFSPRGTEVVRDGIIQWGYEDWSLHRDFAVDAEQDSVHLYISAISKNALGVGIPNAEVLASLAGAREEAVKADHHGLIVSLDGSAMKEGAGDGGGGRGGGGGRIPTVESPTLLRVKFRCERPSSDPYVINVSIPVLNYTPVSFFLLKHCNRKEVVIDERNEQNGWATFGIMVFAIIMLLTAFCSFGFCYNVRMEDKRGVDAVPGFTVMSVCLEFASTLVDSIGRPSRSRSPHGGREISGRYGSVGTNEVGGEQREIGEEGVISSYQPLPTSTGGQTTLNLRSPGGRG